MTMLSYHNDPLVKQKYVARFAEHRRLDQVIQGTGFSNGRGCFVGCTLDNYDHSRFPVELGWPEWLAHLADAIFEGVPKHEAAQFGMDLLEAVPVGVDLESVKWRIAIARHERSLLLLEDNPADYAAQCRAAIQQVIAYCENNLTCDVGSESAAEAARAAESAAWAAWAAEAARAAWQTERDILLATIRNL